MRGFAAFLTALSLACACEAAPPPADGDWVEATGRVDEAGRLLARELDPLEAPEASVKGPVDRVDASRRIVAFGSLELLLRSDARVTRAGGEAMPLERLQTGRRVKVELERDGDAWLAVRLRELGGRGGSLRLRGPVRLRELDGLPAREIFGLPVLLPGGRSAEESFGQGPTSPARGSDDVLRVGDWVEAKGAFGADGVLHAREVGRIEAGKWSVKGPVDSLENDVLRFGPLRLPVTGETEFQDEDGRPARPELRDGERVKVRLQEREGRVEIKRVQRLEGTGGSLRLQGRVESVWTPDRRFRFRLEGFDVDLGAGRSTDWTGLRAPELAIDDEDRRTDEGIPLGKGASLSGEIRMDYREYENLDATRRVADDLTRLRVRSELEFLFPSTPRFSARAELKLSHEQAVHDEKGRFDTRDDIDLGESWLRFTGLLGRRSDSEIGRLLFDDGRDWHFRTEIDGLRASWYWPKVELAAALAQQTVDPEPDERDLLNWLVSARWTPARRQELTLRVLDREGPRWYALSARGRKKGLLSYWLELAAARGATEGRDRRGEAFDAGITWELPGKAGATITIARAEGSGDRRRGDARDGTYRQSGLHQNNGKWNGVTNFRLYGETLEPELANLEIDTLGLGFLPRRKSSVDLVWHRYRLKVPAIGLVDSNVRGRRLDLIHEDVGEAWDLVIGVEEWDHFELELDVGLFRPGKAFPVDRDEAIVVKLKLKYLL